MKTSIIIKGTGSSLTADSEHSFVFSFEGSSIQYQVTGEKLQSIFKKYVTQSLDINFDKYFIEYKESIGENDMVYEKLFKEWLKKNYGIE